MAVSSTTKRKQVTLSTGTDAISTGIYVTDSDQLQVIRTRSSTDTTLTEDTHYTVSFTAGGGAATVTMIGQAASDIITVLRDMDFTQQSEYPDGARISETEVETDFDLSVMRDQQLEDMLERTIRFKKTATDAQIAGAEIDADATAGYVLTAGAGGTGIPGWAAPATSSSVTGLVYSSIALLKAATGKSVGTIAAVADGTDRSGIFQLTNGAPSEAAGDYQGVELTSAVGAAYHWHRLFDGAINPVWFGLSESNADNGPALQAFIDYANSSSPPANHTLAESYAGLIPEGDYTIRTPIKLKKGVTLRGTSVYGTRLRCEWEQVTVSTLTQTGGTATLTTAASHGLVAGDTFVITDATETDYNGFHKVLTAGATTITFTVDAGAAASEATAVFWKHGAKITNYVEDETDEFTVALPPEQNNFGIERLSIMPKFGVATPIDGVCVRLRQCIEPKIHQVRFVLHQTPDDSPPINHADSLTGIMLENCADIDMDGVSFDLGRYHIRCETGRGGTSGISKGRIRNCYFYQYHQYAIYAERAANLLVSDCQFNTTKGSSYTLTGIYIWGSGFGNKLTDLLFSGKFHKAIYLASSRNYLDSIVVDATADSNYGLGGVDVDGDYNVINGLYGNVVEYLVKFYAGAVRNRVKNWECFASRNNFIFPADQGTDPGNQNNIERLETVTAPEQIDFEAAGSEYFAGTMSAVGSAAAFSVFLRCGTNSDTGAAQGLLYMGTAATPPVFATGCFRITVDASDKILALLYGTTATDNIGLKTTNYSWQHGVEHDLLFTRATDGTMRLWLDGMLLSKLAQVTEGTPPANTAAITGTQFAVGYNGTKWSGWVSEAVKFDRVIDYDEYQRLRARTLHKSPTSLAAASPDLAYFAEEVNPDRTITDLVGTSDATFGLTTATHSGGRFDQNQYMTKTGTLSNAQILAANSSPVTLIAAPGAGRLISVESVELFLDYGGTAYVSANNGEFRYSGANKVAQDVSAAFLTRTSDGYWRSAPQSTVSASANTAVVFTVASADPTTGNSPMYYRITYRVIDFN